MERGREAPTVVALKSADQERVHRRSNILSAVNPRHFLFRASEQEPTPLEHEGGTYGKHF
jgi:hypothetical protein